jgi:MFS family permease
VPRSASEAVPLAFHHVRQQLWPLRWREWWRLAVLGFAAGELGGSGCGPTYTAPHPSSPLARDMPAMPWLEPAWLHAHALVLVALVLTGIAVMCLLGVVWAYVTSLCRIALIETLLHRHVGSLRARWRAARPAGRRYFIWQVGLQAAALLMTIAAIGGPLTTAALSGWFGDAPAHPFAVVVTILVVFANLAVLVVFWLVVHVLSKDFLAPVLAVSPSSLRQAVREWIAMLAADKAGFALYLVLKVLLSIPAMILAMAVLFVVLVPVGIVAVAAVIFWAVVAGVTWNLAALAAAGLAVALFVAVVMVVAAIINVPFVVFFPAYGLYFLAPRYAPLAARLEPLPGSNGTTAALQG